MALLDRVVCWEWPLREGPLYNGVGRKLYRKKYICKTCNTAFKTQTHLKPDMVLKIECTTNLEITFACYNGSYPSVAGVAPFCYSCCLCYVFVFSSIKILLQQLLFFEMSSSNLQRICQVWKIVHVLQRYCREVTPECWIRRQIPQ